jgi:hypothetical protein
MRKKDLPKPAEAPGVEIPRRVFSSPPLEIHLSRTLDRFECIQIKEPELVFGENHRCVDPRTGLAAYGPYGDAPVGGIRQLRVGIVGASDDMEGVRSLLEQISRPVEQDPGLDGILHPSFPGLNSCKPFSVDVVTQTSWHRSINPQMVRLAADCDDSFAKYGMLRELFGAQVRAMSHLEFPPNVVICAIPARVESSLLRAACAQSLPTEIVCDGRAPEIDGLQKDKATQAWDLSIRLLYKSGFTPWRLADAAGDSCFVGVSFYRETGSASPDTWSCFAHVVTDLGQGFILNGETFEWKPNKQREGTPRLNEEQAATLMSRVLEVYGKTSGHVLGKVVIHKTSPYSEAERAGFEDALREIKRHGLVSVSKSGTFVLRPGRKPVFRGTAIPFGEKLGVVYVSGYVPFLRGYPGNRMPQPFEITENWGTLTFQEAAKDLLRLTKLNWSSSAFSTEIPVTLAFPSQAREMIRILGQENLVLDDRYST